MRWKEEVEKVARVEGLRNRKSLAHAEGIRGYCFALDNVGWRHRSGESKKLVESESPELNKARNMRVPDICIMHICIRRGGNQEF